MESVCKGFGVPLDAYWRIGSKKRGKVNSEEDEVSFHVAARRASAQCERGFLQITIANQKPMPERAGFRRRSREESAA
jgi:hypothetical protein